MYTRFLIYFLADFTVNLIGYCINPILKAIVAEKQRLRDITKISVTTLDELKALQA
jgi:hypothetical protein